MTLYIYDAAEVMRLYLRRAAVVEGGQEDASIVMSCADVVGGGRVFMGKR